MKGLDNYKLRINQIINTYGELFLRNNNIVAVGRGNKITKGLITNSPSLTFFVTEKISKNLLNPLTSIPPNFKGVVTDVLETKYSNYMNTHKKRLHLEGNYEKSPALGGGNIIINEKSSTLGYAVTEKNTRKNIFFLGSCHHLTLNGIFEPDKKVYYRQSLTDPNERLWLLGITEKIIPLKYTKSKEKIEYNSIDAGIGYVGPNISETRTILSPNLTNGTKITGLLEVDLNDKIYKVSGFSGYTEGTVLTINSVCKLNDSSQLGNIYLKDQIISNIPSTVGDSGAIGIHKENNKAFGMLNGGDSKVSYFSDIFNVCKLLNIELLN